MVLIICSQYENIEQISQINSAPNSETKMLLKMTAKYCMMYLNEKSSEEIKLDFMFYQKFYWFKHILSVD